MREQKNQRRMVGPERLLKRGLQRSFPDQLGSIKEISAIKTGCVSPCCPKNEQLQRDERCEDRAFQPDWSDENLWRDRFGCRRIDFRELLSPCSCRDIYEQVMTRHSSNAGDR